jgi:hypothetical protein
MHKVQESSDSQCYYHCQNLLEFNGYEPLDFIRFREFFWLAEELLASKEGLCSMELDITVRHLGPPSCVLL